MVLHVKDSLVFHEGDEIYILFPTLNVAVNWLRADFHPKFTSRRHNFTLPCAQKRNNFWLYMTINSHTNKEAILAVMNTTELVVKLRPEKIQVRTGFQPTTFTIRVQRSTNWANRLTGSCWLQINHLTGEYMNVNIWKSYIWAVTASLIVFKTARIAPIFVTFDYVFKTLHELLHDAEMILRGTKKPLRISDLKRFPYNNMQLWSIKLIWLLQANLRYNYKLIGWC